MAYDKNTKLITLDKVVIGDEEFEMTSREVEIGNMHDRLIVENFGSTYRYYDLCTKYFNKYYFEVEKNFADRLHNECSTDIEEGYNELLNAIRKEIKVKQTKDFLVTTICIIVLLILGIKFWYVFIGIALGVFLAKGFALI